MTKIMTTIIVFDLLHKNKELLNATNLLFSKMLGENVTKWISLDVYND